MVSDQPGFFNANTNLEVEIFPGLNAVCLQKIKDSLTVVTRIKQDIGNVYLKGDKITMNFGQTIDSTNALTTVVLNARVERSRSRGVSV